MLKKIGFIQIPKSIVKNPKLSANDFLMVVRLKYLMFISDSDVLTIDMNKLKENMCIQDTRTIKKIFDNLQREKIVQDVTMGRRRPIEVRINKKMLDEKPYAQLPSSILGYVEKVGSTGIRLLYYYESYTNRNKENPFCFTGVRTIIKETGLSDKTILGYNNALVKNRLLKIKQHELKEDGYDENDSEIINKYNNHYFVRLDYMVNQGKEQE